MTPEPEDLNDLLDKVAYAIACRIDQSCEIPYAVDRFALALQARMMDCFATVDYEPREALVQ